MTTARISTGDDFDIILLVGGYSGRRFSYVWNRDPEYLIRLRDDLKASAGPPPKDELELSDTFAPTGVVPMLGRALAPTYHRVLLRDLNTFINLKTKGTELKNGESITLSTPQSIT